MKYVTISANVNTIHGFYFISNCVKIWNHFSCDFESGFAILVLLAFSRDTLCWYNISLSLIYLTDSLIWRFESLQWVIKRETNDFIISNVQNRFSPILLTHKIVFENVLLFSGQKKTSIDSHQNMSKQHTNSYKRTHIFLSTLKKRK